MVTIIDPHIKRADGYYVKQEASEKQLFVQTKNGDEFEGWCWPGSSSWVDYTNPEARKWWAELFSYEKYIGSSSALYTWNDMNEPSVFSGPEITMPKDNLHHLGWEHRDMHNIYGMMLHRSTYSGHIHRSWPARHKTWSSLPASSKHSSLDHQPHRPFILSRAFFAGTQRYGAIWTGDNIALWSHLAAAPPMLLSISLAGVTFCGADVGGFFGNPDAELLTRWYQAGAYYPFFRGHAHIDTKRREPWLFGEPYTGLIRAAIVQRYKLLPYWYLLFKHAQVTGVAPMRPMYLEFPGDEATYSMDDQFMVGGALLVKSVVKSLAEGGDKIFVYLPIGAQTWYNLHSFLAYSRPSDSIIAFETPLSAPTLALQRAGTVLPMWTRVRRSTVAYNNDPLTLQVALTSDGVAKGEYYWDAGDGFGFALHGEFVHKIVNVTIGSKGLDIVASEVTGWSGLEPTASATMSTTSMEEYQKPFLGDHRENEHVEMSLISSAKYRSVLVENGPRIERITLLTTSAIAEHLSKSGLKMLVNKESHDASTLVKVTTITSGSVYGNEVVDGHVHAVWKVDIKLPSTAASLDWTLEIPFK